MIELYFSTVKILAQSPTHISAVATVLLITKTFTVKYYYRERERERERERVSVTKIVCLFTMSVTAPKGRFEA